MNILLLLLLLAVRLVILGTESALLSRSETRKQSRYLDLYLFDYAQKESGHADSVLEQYNTRPYPMFDESNMNEEKTVLSV